MEIVFLVLLGFGAGLLGGLLGIGGSIVMIPAIAYLLGWPFHLAQAIAMTANPLVAISAARNHRKAGNINWQAFARITPISIACIAAAAWWSNHLAAPWLEAGFGIFLLWVLWNLLVGLREQRDPPPGAERTTMARCAVVATATGSASGLLGIGGGLVRVPLMHRLCSMPLRSAIGTSSAIMFVTAIVGAAVKDMTLPEAAATDGASLFSEIMKGMWILPGAIIGATIGARLTTALPLRAIRIVFAMLVAIAATRMFWSAASLLP